MVSTPVGETTIGAGEIKTGIFVVVVRSVMVVLSTVVAVHFFVSVEVTVIVVVWHPTRDKQAAEIDRDEQSEMTVGVMRVLLEVVDAAERLSIGGTVPLPRPKNSRG